MYARMEAQRVRKSSSTFAPRATNSATLHLLSETGRFCSVLQSQACCQLHQGAVLTLKYPRHQSFGSCRRTACMQSSPSMQRALLSRRSEEHTSELQSRLHLVCRLLLEKKKIIKRRAGFTRAGVRVRQLDSQ